MSLSRQLNTLKGNKEYDYNLDPKALTYADFLSLIEIAIEERKEQIGCL